MSYHKHNKHQGKYDFGMLRQLIPEIEDYLIPKPNGKLTLDFSSSSAVRLLNQGLLRQYYNLQYWDFPKENLCPPIPSRAEYIHFIYDLLKDVKKPKSAVTLLDIGTGATMIYPIIGHLEYLWSFIATDANEISIENAQKIIDRNENLSQCIVLKRQDQDAIFRGIIEPDMYIDCTICNPPFFKSYDDHLKANARKTKNITKGRAKNANINFAGKHHELVYPGGEEAFIKEMIDESLDVKINCLYFTTLVSKASILSMLESYLTDKNPTLVRSHTLEVGNKKSYILVWSFLTSKQMTIWKSQRS